MIIVHRIKGGYGCLGRGGKMYGFQGQWKIVAYMRDRLIGHLH